MADQIIDIMKRQYTENPEAKKILMDDIFKNIDTLSNLKPSIESLLSNPEKIDHILRIVMLQSELGQIVKTVSMLVK
jgi:hypothetical protein